MRERRKKKNKKKTVLLKRDRKVIVKEGSAQTHTKARIRIREGREERVGKKERDLSGVTQELNWRKRPARRGRETERESSCEKKKREDVQRTRRRRCLDPWSAIYFLSCQGAALTSRKKEKSKKGLSGSPCARKFSPALSLLFLPARYSQQPKQE